MSAPAYIVVDGELLPESEATGCYTNRAFQYGDGVFETIRAVNGIPAFIVSHHARMMEGLKAMRIDPPADLSAAHMESLIVQLLQKNGYDQGARVRLTVSRRAGGTYRPSSTEAEYVITCLPLQDNEYRLNPDGGSIDIYTDIKKTYTRLTPYKTLNTQIYIMASLWAADQGLDDCLIQNDKHTILEATSSNLFLICNGVLYTPAITEGCLGGVMRMQIINLALANNLKVYECPITPQNLLVADEIFLTNAIWGIRWVSSYKTKRYFNTISRKLLDMLNRKVLSSVKDRLENAT
jgi:branched-chain amino acid aminotransferase